MFADKQDLFDVSVLRNKETGLYVIVREDQCSQLNELNGYDVVAKLKDVPTPVISLLSVPNSAEADLQLLKTEGDKTKKHMDKISEYQKIFIGIVEGTSKRQ